jgi:hypothetical protein
LHKKNKHAEKSAITCHITDIITQHARIQHFLVGSVRVVLLIMNSYMSENDFGSLISTRLRTLTSERWRNVHRTTVSNHITSEITFSSTIPILKYWGSYFTN